MKHLLKLLAILIMLCATMTPLCPEPVFNGKPISQADIGPVRVYEVHKYVKDFPDKEDMSTPESAYSVLARMLASGEMARWRKLSCKATKSKVPAENAPRKAVDPKVSEMYSGGRIREARIWRGDHAAVIAEVLPAPGYSPFDIRFLVRENGQWLNQGDPGHKSTLEEARAIIKSAWTHDWYETEVCRRDKVADPAAYLRPYVDFLRANAHDPRVFTLDALKKHQLVIMGEIHNRPLQWQFNSSVVTDPEFAKNVGTIYMELPMNDQELVDKFLASPRADPEPVIETLRDVFEQGWPSQTWLDFFMTVWMVNRELPQSERIRVVLVDMQRPWSKIQKREDWKPYDLERNQLMAQNLLDDIRNHPEEKRHRLFIVGFAHAFRDFYASRDTGPAKSAGWYLNQKLGAENVFAIFPHVPVMTNFGSVSGRLCLGLFEAAFAELGNKPMAFTLAKGPFGEQTFDAAPDMNLFGHYSDGYDAYLYLGPLEYEIYSPVIARFYTPDFITEYDRRTKLMYGKGWAQMSGQELTLENVLKFMNSWGSPQDWIRYLGPRDAWHYGDDWKTGVAQARMVYVKDHPEEIASQAQAIFDAVRRVDYTQTWSYSYWQRFVPDAAYDCNYMDEWSHWMYVKFKPNPIESVDLGKTLSWKVRPPYHAEMETPSIAYKLTLKDGTTIEGDVAFFYNAAEQKWYGFDGLDWHRKKKPE